MSDHLSTEEVESKLSLVVRKPQEGKTYICISNINADNKSIHIVLTMNTLSAGMQFFGRMEDAKIDPKKIIVFNSKKETAGDCHYARTVNDVLGFLMDPRHEIKVIVCCAHVKKIRESIIDLIRKVDNHFRQSGRSFTIHIDEAHKYIAENKEYIRVFNASPVVNSMIGYSGTPHGIWSKDVRDPLFYKILIRDVEVELQIIRSPDYFGVNRCEFHIFEEEFTHEEIVLSANINPNISQIALLRADMTERSNISLYRNSYFDFGDEILLLSYISLIIPRMKILPDSFSYHFVPAYTRKATHHETVEILLKYCPTANVAVSNGDGYELYRNRVSGGKIKSYMAKKGNLILSMASDEQRKKLREPSNMIQELIKDTPNCPTFVTGFICVGMSVTLVNENIGNFDSVIMAHQHYSQDKLYQLCRFLFNYMNWSPEAKSMIKTTQFYSLTKKVVDVCLKYQENVELMSTDFAGKTCSLREIQGLEPEEPSEREVKKTALTSIKLTNPNSKCWKKFKVYEGNDDEEWKKAELFYESIMMKKPSERSRPKLVDGFYHCSTTVAGVTKKPISEITSLEKQSWWSIFQLTSHGMSYARIFVGYDNLDDPSEYTIFIKFAQLEDNTNTKQVLQTYGKKPKCKVEQQSFSAEASENYLDNDD